MFDANEHARLIDEAREAFRLAKRARKAEINAPRSRWARVKDACFNTPIELAQLQAKEHLADARKAAGEAAGAWVEQRTDALLAGNDEASQVASGLREQCEQAKAISEELSKRAHAGQRAQSSLTTARDACSSAHSMETLDMFSKNKGISLMSSMETSDARNAVEAARRAMGHFQEVLQEHSPVLVDPPDDFLDLVVDIGIGGMDVFSLLNMSALSNAQGSCENALSRISPVVQKLQTQAEKGLEVLRERQRLLEEARAPFRSQALAELPVSVRNCIEGVVFDTAPRKEPSGRRPGSF